MISSGSMKKILYTVITLIAGALITTWITAYVNSVAGQKERISANESALQRCMPREVANERTRALLDRISELERRVGRLESRNNG